MNFYIMFVICFLVGAVLSALMSLILFSKFKNSLKQEFVHIASNAVKTEQEDLRKQNREALEEKIRNAFLPLPVSSCGRKSDKPLPQKTCRIRKP